MNEHFKEYKKVFRRSLRPMFGVLVARRGTMNTTLWEQSVEETLRHVANNPVEYLGANLPDKRIVADILHEIRNEFFKEMSTFHSLPRH